MAFELQALPKFENPPVNEVVFDVTFKRISDFTVPYIGLLWNHYKAEYPTCEEQPPIVDPSSLPDLEQLKPRVWFVHADDSRVIQIQNDRFVFNWRKREDDYPSYEIVSPDFKSRFLEFKNFLAKNNLGDCLPLRPEITYINTIVKGSGWETLGDIQDIFPDLDWTNPNKRFLSVPDTLSWGCSFELPEKRGILTVKLNTGSLRKDNVPILMLEIKVRGIQKEISEEELFEWFDYSHKIIVLAFDDLTSQDIQNTKWKKI